MTSYKVKIIILFIVVRDQYRVLFHPTLKYPWNYIVYLLKLLITLCWVQATAGFQKEMYITSSYLLYLWRLVLFRLIYAYYIRCDLFNQCQSSSEFVSLYVFQTQRLLTVHGKNQTRFFSCSLCKSCYCTSVPKLNVRPQWIIHAKQFNPVHLFRQPLRHPK